MKKFIIQITLVSFAYFSLSLFVYLRFFFSKIDADVEKTMVLASTKYPFVIKKIRIGDSVGKQLHSTGAVSDSGIINLTSNYGVSLLGHYLLLKKITTVNKDNLSDSLQIEGFFRPASLAYNLDGEGATNYFIKKFYNKDWFFDTTLLDAGSAAMLDKNFLGNYPKKILIKHLYPIKASHRILDISSMLNPSISVPKNTRSLSDALAPLMLRNFPQYQTFYNPVSQTNAVSELKNSHAVRSIWKPKQMFMVLNDSVFMKDNIHFKQSPVYKH